MKKKNLITALLIILFGVSFTSCVDNSKLERATDMLSANFRTLVKQDLEKTPLKPDSLYYDGKDVIVKFLEDTKSDYYFKDMPYDAWIAQMVAHEVFGGSINASILADVLGGEKDKPVAEKYFDLMKDKGALFKIVVGEKTISVVPDEMKKYLADGDHKWEACLMFQERLRDLIDDSIVRSVEFKDGKCYIEFNEYLDLDGAAETITGNTPVVAGLALLSKMPVVVKNKTKSIELSPDKFQDGWNAFVSRINQAGSTNAEPEAAERADDAAEALADSVQ